METLFEKKLKANDLRKSGKYQDALILYKEVFQESSDQYTSAGYLHCLRKLKIFEDAIPLANLLEGKFLGFDWVTNEIIWTYIEGLLYQIPEEEALSTVITVANKILQFHPNQIASNVIKMRVCRAAKHEKTWKILDEWVRKVDPDSLDRKLMQLPHGRVGWSQQGLWYLYRITSFVETRHSEETFPFLEFALEHFPKQKKFFLRLRAHAYSDTGKKEEAIADYKILCGGPHPDWWMLKEYADVLNDIGRKEEALDMLYLAAQARQDPGLMVALFETIGDLSFAFGYKEHAALHYQLIKLIKEERRWKIPNSLEEKLSELTSTGITIPPTINEVFRECQKIWYHGAQKSDASQTGQPHPDDNLRRNLPGKISLGRPDQPYCFITLDDGESVFCYKYILPSGIKHGDYVILDARPSWNQKKGKQGWKAQNVRLKTN